MTTSTAHEVKLRKAGRPKKPREANTPIARLLVVTAEVLEAAEGAQWPNPIFAQDPVSFAETILGVELAPKQVEMLEAIRDHRRVTIRGGRKVGKDFAVAVAALWWFASFPDAKVVITATTAHQVDGVLWLEIRKMFARSGRCLACKRKDPRGGPCEHSAKLTGDLHELARSGLKTDDFRSVTGHTSKEAESMAGISGKYLLHITDEASGVRDEIHTAIRGNLASGESREVMISNPTKNSGHFYESWHSKAELYCKVHASSEETPNVLEGREVFPGMADRTYIDEQRKEWGEKSALYRIHVKGDFVPEEEGQLLSVHEIDEAVARWPDAKGEGVLTVGIDPAGEGGDGDESAFAWSRGLRVEGLLRRSGLSDEGHLVELLGLLAKLRVGLEPVRVHLDSDGEVGWKVLKKIRSYLDDHPDAFELWVFRGNAPNHRDGGRLPTMRDAVWVNLSRWLRAGGSIPEDGKLRRDLHAPKLTAKVNGQSEVTKKKELRKILGRSPDTGDAVCLAVWNATSVAEEAEEERKAKATSQEHEENDRIPTMDPYSGGDVWR